MTRQELEKVRAQYRRAYDKLYVASMHANDAAGSAKINAALQAANARLAKAESEFKDAAA